MLRAVWQRTGFAGKTLWDWLQLLIVPLVLALAAFALNAAQADRDREQDARQAAQERLAAEDGAREDALRGYLQQISDLITHEGLASPRADPDVRTLARTLTLTTLRRLDGERKTLVVNFLLEAGLINQTSVSVKTADGLEPLRKRGAQIPLAGADLRGIAMTGLLPRSSGPNASGRFEQTTASFRSADLRGADFHAMNLVGAEFDWADLRGANFTDAYVRGASFRFACLTDARFVRMSAGGTREEEAYSASFVQTRGRDVDFSDANLIDVSFVGAMLADVDLSGAKTNGTQWPRGWTNTGLAEAPDCGIESG